ncbi:MAG: PKD domain-containing protein, partial [Nanoarchaeota archaeon]
LQNCGGNIEVTLREERKTCSIVGIGCTTTHTQTAPGPGTYPVKIFASFNDGSSKTVMGSVPIAPELPSFSFEDIEISQGGQVVPPITGSFARMSLTGRFFALITGAQTAQTTSTIKVKANSDFSIKLKIKNSGAEGDPSNKFKLQILKADKTSFKILVPKSKTVKKGITDALELNEKDKAITSFQIPPGDYKLRVLSEDDKILKEYSLTAIAPKITASPKFKNLKGVESDPVEREPFIVVVEMDNEGDDTSEAFPLSAQIIDSQTNSIIEQAPPIQVSPILKGGSIEIPINIKNTNTEFEKNYYRVKVLKGTDVLFNSGITFREMPPTPATTKIDVANFPAQIKGSVVDKNLKQGQSEIVVEFLKKGDSAWTKLTEAKTDASGNFDFSNVDVSKIPPGDFDIKISFKEMPEGTMTQIGSLIPFKVLKPGENEFTLTLTGDAEINEGDSANLQVEGAPAGEENSVKYYFIFGHSPKTGLPTETNRDYMGTSASGKASVRTSYANTGTYTQSVLAVSNSGKKSKASHTLTVKNVPPTANAGKDITVNAGQKVPFNGGASSASDSDEKFFYWDVDSSDGLSFAPDKNNADLKDAAPRTYKYSKPGVYTATLRVYDDDGTFADDTVKVTVTEEQKA